MKRGSSSSLLFVWRRCGDDCVSSHNLNGRFNGSMIHHPRSTFNEWPQPQNEEICLAMEEAKFEEKKMAMEIATPAPAPITSPEINIILSPAKTKTHKKNMIQVSNTKKPLFFDVNLAKLEIGLVDLVLIPEQSLAFISIMMVVTISEILKNTGLTTDKKVLTSTVGMKDEAKGKMIEIVLGKSDKFDSLVPPVTNGKTP
ncbi:BnaC09g32180D [Brassica napus]|uniref:BnaC09g32180D protein n=1 Tax=Brassica napus TaxID=3708 RepID=A0A078GU69_BRANA|nr:BnaC09g32180D [Brassica napus]